MLRGESWYNFNRVIEVFPFCIEERIGYPVICERNGFFVAPENINTAGITRSVI
jgi:hypothetical protein